MKETNLFKILLPVKYTCKESPKHLASAAEQFKFMMPYKEYFGGVVAMSWNHLKIVNGMTNRYELCDHFDLFLTSEIRIYS